MMLYALLLAACAADDTCAGDTATAVATSTATSTSTGTGTGGGGGGNGGPGAPPDNFFTILTETGACGDLVFYAHNPEDSLSLVVRVDGLASEARAADAEIVRSWGLADDTTTVRVGARQGLNLSASACDPATGGSGGQAREWVVQDGTLEVAVSADATDTVQASMVLTGATFSLATDTGTSPTVINGGDIAIDADVPL
jgi:hypothetical protein